MSFIQGSIETLKPLVKSLLPQRMYQGIQLHLLGYTEVGRSPDRQYMENSLLPAFARLPSPRVLDVGTRFFTPRYAKFFRSGSEYWTLDIDPAVAQFGSPGRHVTGSVVTAAEFFKPAYFDVVLLNGVFGWGVDDSVDQRMTLKQLRQIMRSGAVLLIGWNHDLTTEDVIAMARAEGFSYSNMLGLSNRKKFSENTHVYDLFTAI